jgi:hypothetical protein
VTLYARNDVMSISVPPTAGGCGASHMRPVTRGVPASVFKLTCPQCESYLKGDRKEKILHTTPGDPKNGIPAKQRRMADSDPLWSSTPETIPLTPDEAETRHIRMEKGEQQLRALESLIALKSAGIDLTDRPEVMYFLNERGLPTDIVEGTTLCAAYHENLAGAKFCAECGIAMSVRAELPAGAVPSDEIPGGIQAGIPLESLHVQTLRRMCRDRDLSDKGAKDVLVGRLQELATA